jgi:hypothetical protein
LDMESKVGMGEERLKWKKQRSLISGYGN